VLLEGLKWMNTKEAPGAADNPDILEWARAEGLLRAPDRGKKGGVA